MISALEVCKSIKLRALFLLIVLVMVTGALMTQWTFATSPYAILRDFFVNSKPETHEICYLRELYAAW